MSKDKPKSKIRTAAARPPKRETVGDDRGLAIWEWAGENGRSGIEASAPLSLAEEALRVKGYSPYDSGLPEKKRAPLKRKDLRKLSEWLKLKKQAGKNRSEP